MLVLRRFRLVVACAALVAAAAFAVHMATQPVVAGKSITWGVPSPPTPQASAGTTATGASPPPAPAATPVSGPLDGLRRPLGALLQRLNTDTAHNAAGQYSILQSLEQALRDYVERFLNWVTGKR
jgi:hypothetical protein